MKKPISAIHIISPPRSGSTLLTYLIASHPQISTIGERNKFHRKRVRPRGQGSFDCSCGLPFTECEYWGKVYIEFAKSIPLESGFYVDHDFAQFKLVDNSRVNRKLKQFYTFLVCNKWLANVPIVTRPFLKMRDANVELLRAICLVGKTEWVVDGSKSIRELAFISSSPEINSYVVNLTRDGRGQTNSVMRYNPQMDMIAAAKAFVEFYKLRDKILQKLSLPTFNLSYEQLCTSPQTELDRIFQFLGIDTVPVSFRQKEQHIMGAASTRLSSPEEIRLDEKWKQLLTTEQLRQFEEIAGETNRRLGYLD